MRYFKETTFILFVSSFPASCLNFDDNSPPHNEILFGVPMLRYSSPPRAYFLKIHFFNICYFGLCVFSGQQVLQCLCFSFCTLQRVDTLVDPKFLPTDVLFCRLMVKKLNFLEGKSSIFESLQDA